VSTSPHSLPRRYISAIYLAQDGYAPFEPPRKKANTDEANADDDAEADAAPKEARSAAQPPPQTVHRSDAREARSSPPSPSGDHLPHWQASARGYDYLLGMPLWSLTFERVAQLQAELATKEEARARHRPISTYPRSMHHRTSAISRLYLGYISAISRQSLRAQELQTLLKTTPKELWRADLTAFEAGLDEWEAELAEAEKADEVNRRDI